MSDSSPRPDEAVTPARVLQLWGPLAASWLLMAFELPIVTMAIARLADPVNQLAAHGAVVMPVSLIVEAPIMMLLSASTALCVDGDSYRLVRRAMIVMSAVLTLLHAAIAFTPLLDRVALDLIGAPPEVLEPARWGLQVMLPWTAAIAYRRFHQGLLIRASKSRPVALGTMVRLASNAAVLIAGTLHGGLPGIVVGTAGIATGVTAEALFVGWNARGVARRLSEVPVEGEPLTLRGFAAFYWPLALTQCFALAVPPISAAAIARMPAERLSLAAWPAAWGFTFVLRSVSYAFNETVVSLMGRPGGPQALRTFAHRLAAGTSLILVLLVSTPAAMFWFHEISGLTVELAELARLALACALLHPSLGAFEMWFQGRLVHARRTRAVTVGMVLHVLTACAGFALGVAWGPLPGILTAVLVHTAASAVKVAWLGTRAGRLVEGP